MKSTLEEVQQYRNDAVVHRFVETWELTFEEASDIFYETKKWLWLNAYVTCHPGELHELAISQSLKLVDEMWHTFILFTREYEDFCRQYFDFYIHHRPTPKDEYERQIIAYERDPEAYMIGMQESFRNQYELIYSVLGEDTLVKWYSTYADRYTDGFMRQIWRWSFSPYDTRVRKQIRLAPSGDPSESARSMLVSS